MMHETVVLGIGNILLRDEGLGIHALNYIREKVSADRNVSYVDGGTLGLMLNQDISDSTNLIVVDAARLNSTPGCVRTFINEEMDEYLRTRQVTAHDVGLSDLFDIVRLEDTLPCNRALIGVQPDLVQWGLTLSPCVNRAMPQVARIAEQLILKWSVEESA